ncbi:hypothetical protein XELAEV_18046161mg [Xenopus laevis]|uniref:Uncharacterized protein n=1 Tax=Xenopus laevis TaxID=8355 RepID=A0A974BSP7_XENLA|nr:hypothetical protein XELAEV_18046161mg [Xenopus laevis]
MSNFWKKIIDLYICSFSLQKSHYCIIRFTFRNRKTYSQTAALTQIPNPHPKKANFIFRFTLNWKFFCTRNLNSASCNGICNGPKEI